MTVGCSIRGGRGEKCKISGDEKKFLFFFQFSFVIQTCKRRTTTSILTRTRAKSTTFSWNCSFVLVQIGVACQLENDLLACSLLLYLFPMFWFHSRSRSLTSHVFGQTLTSADKWTLLNLQETVFDCVTLFELKSLAFLRMIRNGLLLDESKIEI